MKIANNTHYYSINNKVYNIVPDSDSWQFQSNKRLSYSQRLYWEYRYIKSCGGQAFFYTFTYNNDNIPYFEYDKSVFDESSKTYHKVHIKTACFNYAHIRLLTNGLISKVLRRKYGSQLRYFVACERGEGKGKHRKKGQNPHYHVIFFISPLRDGIRKDNDVPYKRISPIQFCHLCKCVWQYQSSPDKYDHIVADYKTARFGHCQPGNDLGLITDFDALSYVSKYVCKDSLQIYDDINVKEYYLEYYKELGYTWHSLYSYYYYLRQDGSIIDRRHFLEVSGLDDYFGWRSLTHRRDVSFMKYLSLQSCFKYDTFYKCFDDYFKNLYLPSIASHSYRDYCNKFGSKVRTSKSLGIYGLQFVKDTATNPHFVLNKSDEVVAQPICLYYYRKLYMDVVRCPVSGNPLYVLNQDGINLKCLFLKNSIEQLKRSVLIALDFLDFNRNNADLLKFIHSRDLSISLLNTVLSDNSLSDVVERFAIYRLVYQYRHYSSFGLDSQPSISSGFTFDNIQSDYRRFLASNVYSCDYSDLRLVTLIENHRFSDYILSFSSHPSFSSFIDKFDCLEGFYSVFRDFDGEIKKKNFANSVELRQVINSYKYNPILL